jgi:RNA polymerase sigma factor (sigma-70 family)
MASFEIDSQLLKCVLEDPARGWLDFWNAALPVLRWKVGTFHLSREDSEDVLSEISFRLVRNDFKLLRNWDPERCSLHGYLSVVAKSTTLDFVQSVYYRYNQKKETPPEEEDVIAYISSLPDHDETPSERVNQIQVEESVFRIVEKWAEEGGLKPQDRQILKFRLMGVGFQEIAEILGITPQNAMIRFHRVKDDFRKKLEQSGIGPSDSGG